MTCAHVLDAVLSESEIGILCFSVRSKELQTLRVPTDATDSIVIGSRPWSKRGPDIAFLRLPAATMANIERLSSVVNGDLHRQNIIAGVPERTRPYNIVCGMIDEATRPALGRGSTTQFAALLNIGHVFVDGNDVAGMDLFRFQPIASEEGVLPASYQGTSGGGLWQFFLHPDDFSLVQARLSGVVFWEELVGDQLTLAATGRGAYTMCCSKKSPRSGRQRSDRTCRITPTHLL